MTKHIKKHTKKQEKLLLWKSNEFQSTARLSLNINGLPRCLVASTCDWMRSKTCGYSKTSSSGLFVKLLSFCDPRGGGPESKALSQANAGMVALTPWTFGNTCVGKWMPFDVVKVLMLPPTMLVCLRWARFRLSKAGRSLPKGFHLQKLVEGGLCHSVS